MSVPIKHGDFHIKLPEGTFHFSEPGSEVKTDLKSHYVECTKHDVVLHNFLQRAKLLANIIFEIEMLQLHAKMMNKLEL